MYQKWTRMGPMLVASGPIPVHYGIFIGKRNRDAIPCICLRNLDQYVMMFGLSYMTVGVIKVGLPCVITFYPFTADTTATKSNPKLDSQCKCCKYVISTSYEMENLSVYLETYDGIWQLSVGLYFNKKNCFQAQGLPL